VQIAAAALCWGFAASLAKSLFVQQVDPLTLSQLRASFSFLVLLAIALAFRRTMLRVEPRLALGLALLGVVGIASTNFTYLTAIHLTNVTTAILVQYTAPIWVMLYMAAFGGERLTKARAAAVALSFGGCVLAVGAYQASGLAWNPAGVLWALAAAFGFSFFSIWGSRMARRVELWSSLLWALGAATLFWALIRAPWELAHAGFSSSQWGVFFFYAMISILVPHALFYNGLKRVRPTHAMVTSTLEPGFAILFAFLLVGEAFGLPQALGLAAVIGAILLLQRD
jgi:drug/metabolite transporter, DME family